MLKEILKELRRHAPFTAIGAATGILILVGIILANVFIAVVEISSNIFYILHPFHIMLSAIATTAIYKLHKPKCKILKAVLIGGFGAIGIATLSDCVIPFLGEIILKLPNRGIHLGIIAKPIPTAVSAILGIFIGFNWTRTKIPHFGHILISTWASLFHIFMAVGHTINVSIIPIIFLFLFLAVWLPCCLSDIVFPLIFTAK